MVGKCEETALRIESSLPKLCRIFCLTCSEIITRSSQNNTLCFQIGLLPYLDFVGYKLVKASVALSSITITNSKKPGRITGKFGAH
jgi:hypothetical protein